MDTMPRKKTQDEILKEIERKEEARKRTRGPYRKARIEKVKNR